MSLLEIGKVVTFGKRRGHIVGHVIFKPHGSGEDYDAFYIVHLDPESMGYMETRVGEVDHDTFISSMIVRCGNLNEDGEDVLDEPKS